MDYSYLSAVIGSSAAARRAGHTPNTTPTSAENPNASPIDPGLISVFQSANELSAIAPPVPDAKK